MKGFHTYSIVLLRKEESHKGVRCAKCSFRYQGRGRILAVGTCDLTRRGFLRTSVASAMLASAGAAGYSSWWAKAAHAEEAPKKTKVPTECNGCSNKCGIWVHTENGVISTVEGMKEHPYSKGTVCARGHGFAQ